MPDEASTMATKSGPTADRYLSLVVAFPLRPIRSDEELDRAIAMVDSLLDRDLEPGEQDYLDVLSDQVQKYEVAQHPRPSVPAAEILRHLIEARGINQTDLATDTGIAESTISSLLSGKRAMSRKHVGALATYFQVSPAVFLS